MKIAHFFRNHLLLLILAAIVSRVYVFSFVPHHLANPWDSVNYGEYAIQFLHYKGIQDVLNPIRPPVYPVLLAGSLWLAGINSADQMYSVLNSTGGLAIALSQLSVLVY